MASQHPRISPLLLGTLPVLCVIGVCIRLTAEAPPLPSTPIPVEQVSPLADVPRSIFYDIQPSAVPEIVGSRLVISAIKVSAPIVDVGLTKEGNMDVPQNIAEVGRFTQGAQLGEQGTLVLAGHLDGKRGEAGVFANLHKVRIGDTLTLVKDDGSIVTYVVRKTQTYNQDERPPEVFDSGEGAHLSLITCTGPWDTRIGKFSKRLVVFADLAT